MILKMEKKFLQYDAQKSHVSEIIGVGVQFILNNFSLRRWVATMYLSMVLIPDFLLNNIYKLVRGV